MGCLPSHTTMKPSKTSMTHLTLKNEQSDSRNTLLTLIYYLHDITLMCTAEIEECIIENKKNFALVLKKKRFCVKKKLKEVQILVAKYDKVLESETFNVKQKIEIDKKANQITKEIENSILYEKEVKFENKNQEYIEKLNKEIEKFGLDDSQIELELQQEIQIQEVKSRKGPFIRKKFRTRRDHINETINNQ